MSGPWMIDKKLRLCASLVVGGLLIELFSLFWSHPTAFLVFVGVGGLLLAAGVLLYLFVLLRSAGTVRSEESSPRV